MKVVIFFILAGFTVECHRTAQKFPDFSESCMEVHHITAEELYEFDRGDIDPNHHMHKKFKCYAHCLLQRTDYLDEMGKISIEKLSMREDIAEEQLEMVTECKAEHDVEDDDCEYGFGIITCLLRVISRED